MKESVGCLIEYSTSEYAWRSLETQWKSQESRWSVRNLNPELAECERRELVTPHDIPSCKCK